MNATLFVTSLCLLCAAIPAPAQDPTPSLPAVRADAVHYVFDCGARTLPTQRAVGEWTGQHNFSQVYDTRQRLMGEVARACGRDGIEQVHLVLEPPQARDGRRQWVARLEPRNH